VRWTHLARVTDMVTLEHRFGVGSPMDLMVSVVPGRDDED
jgi:hypothetical protein